VDFWERETWEEEDEFERGQGKKHVTFHRFSLDFLSRIQKQTIIAVALLLVVLSAKYSGDPASSAVMGVFRTALSSTNDYSTALNDLAKGYLGVGQELTTAKSGGIATLPLEGTLVSGFGWQISPLDQEKRYNAGVYLGASLGTYVLNPMAGTVTKTGIDPVWGKYIKLDHGGGVTSLIANLGEVKSKPQQRVNKGEKIATLGFSAAMKRPWLYWEVRRNNQPIDPLSLTGKGAPSKI